MAVLTGILNSKRALLCVTLIIAATVLAAMAVFTKQDWIDYTKYIVTIWVGGETVTKAMEIYAGSKKAERGDVL